MTPIPFDPRLLIESRGRSHGSRLGVGYRAHGEDWCELTLPFAPELVGDVARGMLASGPIIALLDMATSIAVWQRRGGLVAHATLDLRVDYLRGATPETTVIGRGECYRVTKSVAFVRGIAHDGDTDDPIAHVAGTFMSMGADA